MTTFLLIRHGDKEPVPPDPDLNKLGKEQALQTAEFLTQFPISHIISSPLKRARQTADYTADFFQLPVKTDIRLRERINWGDDPTLDREAFIQLWKETTLNRDHIPKFGNSSRQTGEFLKAVMQEQGDSDHNYVALFTHGGAIADFLRNVLPESELSAIKATYPDGYDYEIHECSITTAKFDTATRDFLIININQTDHLQALNSELLQTDS